jgi:hypothetical protein
MNEYNNLLTPGELWIRTPDGEKRNATEALSSVFSKYSSLSTFSTLYSGISGERLSMAAFYSELTSNYVQRMDTFYDCIFLETPSGCVFEKLVPSENGYEPYNLSNLFTTKLNRYGDSLNFNTNIDYWFNENEKAVYYGYVVSLIENKNFNTQFAVAIIINKYDCSNNSIRTLLFEKLVLTYTSSQNWSTTNYSLETPKITFNPTTQTYNFSFLLKNAIKQPGLISINFKRGESTNWDDYIVTEVNGHLPFFNLLIDNCYIEPYEPTRPASYRILTVASNPFDPAFNLKFIIVPTLSEDAEIVDKYLVIE